MKLFKILFLSLLSFFILEQKLIGYNLPSIDLGLSNFLCGLPWVPDKGWYMSQYLVSYNADKFTDGEGNLIDPEECPKYNAVSGITVFTYQSNCRFLKARPGVVFGVPYWLMAKTNKNSFVTSSGRGFGDLISEVFLQWDMVKRNGRDFFQSNAGILFTFPTGKWVVCPNASSTINPGNNLFSISPFWAYTFYITPKLTFSGVDYYVFSTKNRTTKILAGHAVVLLYDLLYQCTDKFYFGFNGYYVQQLQNDKLNNVAIPKSKERVLGSGAGIFYEHNKHNYLTLHLYFESLARNRTQGTNFVFRWIYVF